MKIETGSTGAFRPAWRKKAIVLPIYAVLASSLVLIWFSGLVEVSYESRWMTLLFVTLLVTGVSAWGAVLAVRGYLASGLTELLHAASGLTAMGSAFLIASLIIEGGHGPNDAVTVHNIGVFLASLLHLSAALHVGRPKTDRPNPSAFKAACACTGVLVLTGLFWAAAQYDLAPTFYIPEKGSTPVRQLVLTLSIALFSTAAAFLVRHAMQRDSLAMRCYGLGLCLIAMGLVDVSIAVPGSIFSWLGRLSQGFGHVYLLAAFMIAIRAANQKGFDVKEVAADYYLESEDHYRALVNALRAAVISLDPEGRVVLWNQQAKAMSGYRFAEAAGKPLIDLIASDGDGREMLRRFLDERPGRYLEVTLRRKNGVEFPAEAMVFAASASRTKWTNLIIRDISDRRQAEDELHKRELRLRQALQVSRSFAFEWNPATDRFIRSEECGPLLGLHGDEAVHDTGCNFFLRLHPQDRENFVALLQALTPEAPSYTTKYRLVRPDGEIVILNETGLGFFDAEQRLRWLTGISTDVTDREKAQAEIDYLASFPKLNPNPIVEADMEGNVRFSNPTAMELFPDLQPRGKDHSWLRDWSTVCESLGCGNGSQVIRELSIGGKWYYQTLHFIPESRTVRVYGMDITGLKVAEEELSKVHERLATILESISDGFFNLDRQFRVMFVNESGARAVGQMRETMRGRVLWDVFPEAVGSEFERAYQTAMTDRVAATVEAFYPPLNAWFEARAYPSDDGLSVFFRNITDRKLADQALRASETRFRLLADTAAQLLATRDPQAYINELANRVMAHLDCHCFFNFLVAEEQPGRLRLNAWAGIPAEEARRIEWLDYGVAVCGCVARDGVRIAAEHIPTTPDMRTELVKSYGIKAYVCHPLMGVNGRMLGTLSFGTRSRETFSEDGIDLMKAVADQVAVAMVRMQNERDLRRSSEALQQANESLEEKVLQRTSELEGTVATLKNEILVRKKVQSELHQLTRKSLEALEADRRTVARELHDSIGGSLAAIKFGLEEAAELAPREPVGLVESLGALISHLADTIKETKRISANLRPLSLDDLGLLATIEWYSRQFCQRYENIQVVRQIEVEEQDIPEEFKIVFYRVMQEAMTNAAKHSRADTIYLRLKKDVSHFEFEVTDNGCGFNSSAVLDRQDGLSGFGLKSMRERAEICGGVIELKTWPGEGTSVRVRLPVAETASGF